MILSTNYVIYAHLAKCLYIWTQSSISDRVGRTYPDLVIFNFKPCVCRKVFLDTISDTIAAAFVVNTQTVFFDGVELGSYFFSQKSSRIHCKRKNTHLFTLYDNDVSTGVKKKELRINVELNDHHPRWSVFTVCLMTSSPRNQFYVLCFTPNAQ